MVHLTAARHDRRPSSRRVAAWAAGAVGLALVASVLPVGAQAAEPPPPRRIVTGWMPYWTSTSSTASFVPNADLFSEISPFWYSATWTGSTSAVSQQVSSTNKSNVLAALRASGVKIVPAVTDGMPARRMAAVMKSPSARATLVSKLVSTAVTNGYAGLDLDFEKFAFSDGSSTWSTTRPAWVAFVAALSKGLHAKGKILAVTTPPIYNAQRVGSSGYWVYDWKSIAPYVDRLRIMAYDYHVSVPGPIAPFSWVESVVKFAITQVPSGKVQIGVPTYGRDWVRRTSNTGSPTYPYRSTGICPVDNKPSFDRYTFTSASIGSVLAARGLDASVVQWDPVTKERWFRYSKTYSGKDKAGAATSCSVAHEVWFDDDDAVVSRATLVGKYRLAGIAQWTIGGEDSGQWSRLRAYARTIAPTSTAVSLSSNDEFTYGVPTKVSARALTSGAPVEGVTATLWFRGRGTSTWVPMATGTTSTTGNVSFLPSLRSRGDLRVTVPGTYDRKSGVGYRTVKIRTAVALSQSSAIVRAGTPVSVAVALLPKVRGQKVTRQVYSAGRWTSIARAYTGKGGRASFSFTPTKRGKTLAYRVVASSTASTLRATARFNVVVR